jgi:hypothetical protein
MQPIEPPEYLHGAILKRINALQMKAILRRRITCGIAFCVSLAALPVAFNYLAGELVRSGFSQYISLVFSDTGALITYWKEFTLALAESLPLIGITAFLSSILALLVAIRTFLKTYGSQKLFGVRLV